MRTGSAPVSLFAIETGLAFLLVLLAAVVKSNGRQRWRWPAWFARLAQRKGLAVTVSGAAALLGRVVLLPLIPIPQPFFHDEFSYLLAADTYASGRLTNPTHPLWPFFESFHIDMIPTYMSMYFPGQGLVLAAGKVLLGHPWWGVAFGTAAMCAAICWMLQGWMPPCWALLGGCIAIVRLGLFSYWANSYWGGSVPALGGALVIGAYPRIRRNPRLAAGLAMSAGFLILGLTRPYEGLLVSIPAVLGLALSDRPWRGTMWRRVWIPAGATFVLMASAMLYYNQRVFLRALTFPYQTNYRQYVAARQFMWQNARPAPVYRHKVMEAFYLKQLAQSEESLHLGGMVDRMVVNASIGGVFFFGTLFVVPLFWLWYAVRDRHIRFVVWASAVFGAGLMMNNWLLPHYASPGTALVYVVLVQCMRHMVQRGSGRFLLRGAGVASGLIIALRLAAGPLGIGTSHDPTMWYGATSQPGLPRAAVLQRLEELPGRHLVIVKYAETHEPADEWVYNAADIDHAKVVWARDMGNENTRLLECFHDRDVWIAEPDLTPPGLTRMAH